MALGPLLEWAAAVVPPRARAATPVFLFGTAGPAQAGAAAAGRRAAGCPGRPGGLAVQVPS